MAEGWPKQRQVLGSKVPRLDGAAKATGRARYTYDINRPGMLHGVMVRCPHAHARIKAIDTTATRKTPGFRALTLIGASRDVVITAIDGNKLTCTPAGKKKAPDERISIEVGEGVTLIKNLKVVTLRDIQPGDRVTIEAEQWVIGRELFYAGDEVAAIAADTEEHARDAARALRIDYEVLEHVISEDEVLKDRKKRTVPAPSNFTEAKGATQGDVEAGFREADAVVEATYGVPVISHQCLEAHGLVAEWTAEGGLTV
ncbi:MAG: molybdopterin-dependent oxidoreductase, partial [Gemmataceae bacterium]|nr:molybdopterin-dependent oxidoreductase [Gemmataceae bacterium]